MTTQAPPTQPTSTQRRLVKGSIAFLATVTVAVTATFCLGGFSSPADDPSTDDAYVSADSTLVSPRVAGHVSEVLVIDNQPVHAGQLLATIDDRDFRLALTSARAQAGKAKAQYDQAIADLTHQQTLIAGARAKLAAAKAQVVFAGQELNRYLKLAKRGAGSLQQAQKARTQLATAHANQDFAQSSLDAALREVDVLNALKARAKNDLGIAKANVEQAALKLSYTRIKSPINGFVAQRTVRMGAFVSPGLPLLAVVPLAQAYVSGNFRETQLSNLTLGQAVSITVDALPGSEFHGRVDSIAPATGLSLSPIRPSNATGNFTKVVQRVAVKIRLDPGQERLNQLRVGMSVIATVHTSQSANQVAQVNEASTSLTGNSAY